MTDPLPVVLSASRRTDIPAFYLDWFMASLERGCFEVVNPFNRRIRRVPVESGRVHTIVFWSKNFGPFLERRIGESLQREGYHLFFNFTLNSPDTHLEPVIPPLDERLTQLRELARRFGPAAIHWRFDPVCHYRWNDGRIRDNMTDFLTIADAAARCGIHRCITSFMDHYPKVQRRTAQLPGFAFVEPALDAKVERLLQMARALAPRRIALQTCCEADVLAALPEGAPVTAGACIPNDRLMKHYGGRLSLRRDAGQRRAKGCRCMTSADVGSYERQPCRHNCLYCYANPEKTSAPKRTKVPKVC